LRLSLRTNPYQSKPVSAIVTEKRSPSSRPLTVIRPRFAFPKPSTPLRLGRPLSSIKANGSLAAVGSPTSSTTPTPPGRRLYEPEAKQQVRSQGHGNLTTCQDILRMRHVIYAIHRATRNQQPTSNPSFSPSRRLYKPAGPPISSPFVLLIFLLQVGICFPHKSWHIGDSGVKG